MIFSARQPERGSAPSRRPGFTLAELLVVMAIIGILATITVVAVAAIAKDARISSGSNAVVAALENARALAMKKNKIVMVVFRPVQRGNEQYVEAITTMWSGDSVLDTSSTPPTVHDRFVPIPDTPAKDLPPGVQVAGPFYRELSGTYYGRSADSVWITQTSLPRLPTEAPGELIGVMYAPDGTTITRNSQNDSSFPWVDFNDNYNTPNTPGYLTVELAHNDPTLPDTNDVWWFDHPDDETFVNVVPFLTVYDDDEAREIFGDDDWALLGGGDRVRLFEISDYITDRADRIHFNRYTGVVMR